MTCDTCGEELRRDDNPTRCAVCLGKELRIRQRKAFNSVWKRLIAIHQLDDCLVDEFLNAIEKV
jgi:hypothetical protein